MVRLAAGKIAEIAVGWASLEFVDQLGVTLAPVPTTARTDRPHRPRRRPEEQDREQGPARCTVSILEARGLRAVSQRYPAFRQRLR